MRLGALEDVERSEGQDISLRVFVGQRSASVSTADMDGGELAKLVERCVAMAREAPEDPYAGLAPEALLYKGPAPDFDLDDGSEADPQALRAAALANEDPAKLVGPKDPAVPSFEGLNLVGYDNRFDASRIRRELGWRPRITYSEAIAEMERTYRPA